MTTSSNCPATAAAAVNPAMLAGDVLFLSGQTGLSDDERRHFDVREQTDAAWTQLHSLIEAAGFSNDTIIRTNNVLTDWRDYAGFNAGVATTS